jgi:hypothetical protein
MLSSYREMGALESFALRVVNTTPRLYRNTDARRRPAHRSRG